MKKQNSDSVSVINFWSKLCQIKFDLFYYSKHFSKCVLMNRIIKSIIAVGTVISTAVFMNWFYIEIIKILCMISIVILQACSCLTEYFPYDKRKTELFGISKEIKTIYNYMEMDWLKIVKGEFTEDEIDERLVKYIEECDRIETCYFREDSLPEIQEYIDASQEETQRYFNNFQGVQNDKRNKGN